MKLSVRTRRALAVAAVLAAIGLMLPRFLTHTPYPRLGVTFDRDRRIAEVIGPPALGLLVPGDHLLALNDEFIGDSASFMAMGQKGFPREALNLTVERGDQVLELRVPPVQLSPWQRFRLYAYPLVAVIAAPLVAFLLVWRRPDLSSAWVFLWFAALQAIGVVYSYYQFPQFDVSPFYRGVLRLYGWLNAWYAASFLHFMCVFPRPRWEPGERRRSPWFWLVVVAYLLPFVHVVRTLILPGQPDVLFIRWFETAALVIGTASLLERYSRPSHGWNPGRWQRGLVLAVASVLLLGAAINVLGSDERFLSLLPPATLRVLVTGILIAVFASPLAIAYLIADDPLFDPRRIVVGGLPYALLSGALAGIYLAVVLVGQRAFASLTGEQALAVNVVAALVVAFLFAPLRERLQRAIARVYGRDPVMLRKALDAAGRDLLKALDRDEVRASVEQGMAQGLKRALPIEWPEGGMPRLVDPEACPEFARGAVDGLLAQAAVRLENLSLAEKRADAERRAVELREAATRAELRALQAQVQPHFLFNALNALAYLIESDPPAAQRFSERLADMLRYAVQAGDRPAALLADEIAFVEDYLAVARERYESPLSFQYQGPPELLFAPVPPLLLQPLVENSLKHGLAPGADALHMTLTAAEAAGRVSFEFADDGAPNGNGGPGLGVGLTNLEQRVRRFAGEDAQMAAGPRPSGGYAVRMSWAHAVGGNT